MIIVYAHPNQLGHNGFILRVIENKLKQTGKNYEVWDLYKMNFNPVMIDEKINPSSGRSFDQFLGELQNKIVSENDFIFIYPVWWNNVPAILKGFFDRIFLSGFAFRYVNKFPRPLLKGKRALVFTTSGGPAWHSFLLKCSRSTKVTTSDTLNFCGFKTKSCTFGGCRELNESFKKLAIKKVEKKLSKFFK